MSKFRDLWKAITKEDLHSYIKRLNITSGMPSKVVDASYAQKADVGHANRLAQAWGAAGQSVAQIEDGLRGDDLGLSDAQRRNIARNYGKGMQKTPDVGLTYAGQVPISLLSAQDLEGPTRKTITIRKDGSDHDLTIQINNGSEETAKAVFEGCEMGDIVATTTYNGVKVYMTPEMSDEDGKRVGCYVLVGQDGHLQAFFSEKDACDFIDSVLKKGQVEETKKDLIEMAEDAKDGDETKKGLVQSIKAVQVKRQKATIAARSKEMQGKSFRDILAGRQ